MPAESAKHDLGSLRIHDGQRAKSGMGRRIMYASIPVIIFGAIVATAFALRSQKPVVEVATAAKPSSEGPQTALNASGYITPRRRATIAAKITGRVTAVYFDEGTRVKEGQLLSTLDDSDYRRALDSAKADRDASQAAIQDFEVQLRNAEIQLKRAQELRDSGIQTQEALDNARTAVDSLRAKIALTKNKWPPRSHVSLWLSKPWTTAPFARLSRESWFPKTHKSARWYHPTLRVGDSRAPALPPSWT